MRLSLGTIEYLADQRVSCRSVDPLYLLIAASAMALPWLMPIHARPWTNFHADAAMAVVAALLALFALLATRGPWRMPPVALVFAALAFVPAIQYWSTHVAFAGDAWLASTYLLAISLSIIVGTALSQVREDQPALIILGSFGIASGLTLFLALNQWLQLDQWPEVSLTIPAGGRAIGNVGQPNILATLFAWGLIALWWFQGTGRVRPVLAMLAALLLLLGVVTTRSRVGAAEVLVILTILALHRSARCSRLYGGSYIALAMWFILLTVAWTPLNASLGLLPQPDLTQRLQPGTRLLHWELILDAITQRPLFGWGWQQVVMAQSALAVDHQASGEVINYSHNLILDLMVWNGVPLGTVIFIALSIWFVSRWRKAQSNTARALMLALSVLLLHALVELPHGYATMLIPAGLIIGAVEGSVHQTGTGGHADPRAPRWAVATILGLLVVGLAITVHDYIRIEKAWTDERIRIARIGSLAPVPLPDAPTLDHLISILQFGRDQPRAGMTEAELIAMERTAYRFPGPGNLLRLARAQSLNGQMKQAERTIQLICRTHSERTCVDIKRKWDEQAL